MRRRSDVTDTENIIPEVCTRARVAFDSVDVPSLRPTPPKRYALVPTTVNECPERGSGGVPFRGAGSHVTDCEGGKRGQSRPVHRVGIDRGVALVVDGRVGRGRRAPDAATTRPKRDCLKRERAI